MAVEPIPLLQDELWLKAYSQVRVLRREPEVLPLDSCAQDLVVCHHHAQCADKGRGPLASGYQRLLPAGGELCRVEGARSVRQDAEDGKLLQGPAKEERQIEWGEERNECAYNET